MIISCSTNQTIDMMCPNQGLNDILNANFKYIAVDYSAFFSKSYKQNYNEAMIKPQAINESTDKLKKEILSRGNLSVHASIVFATRFMPFGYDNNLYNLLLETGINAISFSEKCNCKAVVIQPIDKIYTGREDEDIILDYYLKLSRTCKKNDTMLLLENQCVNYNGHIIRGACSNPYEVKQLIDKLNAICGRERFGFCLNTGNFSLCGQNMRLVIDILNSHIKAVVIKDCSIGDSASLLAFTATSTEGRLTDWNSIICGLRDIGYNKQLVMEFSDTASAFSSLLKPALINMAYEIAEYLRFQIEIENNLKKYNSIVLFGAGNMCINYMKQFGIQYKPMFTCDNNKNKWGSTIEGLEIKSPDALKNLPSDCGVFICNMYYREIEKQLKKMGIKNIEIYNDEYI